MPIPTSGLQHWPRLRSRVRDELPVCTLLEHRVQSPRTGEEHDFYVLQARDWVNVIPVTPEGNIVLVRQYRHGIDRISLEIPGGIMDEGEEPVVAALRELREETGFSSSKAVYLGAIDVNPAMFTNQCHAVLALDVRLEHALEQDAGEDLETLVLPRAEVEQLLRGGHIGHSLVMASFLLWHLYEREIAAGERSSAA